MKIQCLRAWAAAALVALSACPRDPDDQVTLGMVRLPALGLVAIADAKGYFPQEGLRVEQRLFSSGRDALAALEAGEVDAATSFETPIVLWTSGRSRLAVLTMLHRSTRDARVVARRDRGIAGAADLAGKRIGIPRGTHSEYFLHVLLSYAGVAAGSVELVDVAPDAIVEAITTGGVDAIATWSPHVERARRALGATGIEIGTDLYVEISALSTREDVVRSRHRALVKLVRALARAERLAREQPAEALAALRRAFPELSDADLQEAWGEVRPTLGLTHELAATLERQSAWFQAAGRADPIDVSRLLAPDVLSEVEREAVTFVTPARPGEDP